MRFTKRMFPIVLVFVLALCLASQALADPAPTPSPSSTPQTFTCLGKVTATTANTVTITVKRASCALQGSLGQSLTLNVTDSSVLTALSQGHKTPVAATDVPAGDLLQATGTIDASSTPLAYDISKACVWQPRFKSRFLCLGTVTSVTLDPASLTVSVARGSLGLRGFCHKDITIDVPDGAKVFAVQRRSVVATTFGQITTGDRVWITGVADRSDPSAPVFCARRVLVHHPVPVGQLTWYACRGQVSSVDPTAGTVSVTVARATRALHGDIGEDVTLTITDASVIRTLSEGVVTAVSVGDLTSGESIVVSGPIDRSDPANPVYDVGHAFVWQPVAGLVRNAA